jgi:hypothetical protein
MEKWQKQPINPNTEGHLVNVWKNLKAGIWLLTALDSVFPTRCDCFQLFILFWIWLNGLNIIERIEYDDWKLRFTSECVQLCEWNDLCIKKFKNNSFEEKLLCKNGYDMIGSLQYSVWLEMCFGYLHIEIWETNQISEFISTQICLPTKYSFIWICFHQKMHYWPMDSS